MLKHYGELPIIGVNTFKNPHADEKEAQCAVEPARATEEEKHSQLTRPQMSLSYQPPAPEAILPKGGRDIFPGLLKS